MLGEQLAVDLAHGVELLARGGERLLELKHLPRGLPESLLQAIGAWLLDSLVARQLISDLAAERLREAPLERSDLLSQALVLRLVVLGVGAQRGARDARASARPLARADSVARSARSSSSARRSGWL